VLTRLRSVVSCPALFAGSVNAASATCYPAMMRARSTATCVSVLAEDEVKTSRLVIAPRKDVGPLEGPRK
jgi:hypothetical protein